MPSREITIVRTPKTPSHIKVEIASSGEDSDMEVMEELILDRSLSDLSLNAEEDISPKRKLNVATPVITSTYDGEEVILTVDEDAISSEVEKPRKRKRNSRDSAVRCGDCFCSYNNVATLKKHMLTHKPRIIKSKGPEPVKVYVYVCDKCGETHSAKNKHLKHMRSEHRDERERNFMCNRCDKGFSTHPDLKRHIKFRHLVQSIKCQICDRLFNSPSILELHMTSHKTQLKCDTCGMRFRKQTARDKHMQLHDIKKQFRCNICWKSYQDMDSLVDHVVTHRSEEKRLFTCSLCSESFLTIALLQKHIHEHRTQNLLF